MLITLPSTGLYNWKYQDLLSKPTLNLGIARGIHTLFALVPQFPQLSCRLADSHHMAVVRGCHRLYV